MHTSLSQRITTLFSSLCNIDDASAETLSLKDAARIFAKLQTIRRNINEIMQIIYRASDDATTVEARSVHSR